MRLNELVSLKEGVARLKKLMSVLLEYTNTYTGLYL